MKKHSPAARYACDVTVLLYALAPDPWYPATFSGIILRQNRYHKVNFWELLKWDFLKPEFPK